MKGLLRNSFYGAMGSAFVTLAIFVVLGIAVIITADSTLLIIFSLASATVFTINALSSFRKEAATNWYKHMLTAPIRRKDIVKSRYISHTLWCLGGMILVVAFVGITVLFHGNRFFYNGIRDPITLLCIGLGIPTLMGSIFYPLIYLFGSDKNELMMILALAGAAGITAGVIGLINMCYEHHPISDAEYFAGLSVYMGVVVVSFFSSYFLAAFIDRRKEY